MRRRSGGDPGAFQFSAYTGTFVRSLRVRREGCGAQCRIPVAAEQASIVEFAGASPGPSAMILASTD